MTAAIQFLNTLTQEIIPSISGIGFFGTNFGTSVPVGQYQTTVYTTDSGGTVQGSQNNSLSYLTASSGALNGDPSPINVNYVPNYQSTINIRFTNGTPVNVSNVRVWPYDRNNVNNGPSGIICKFYEHIHTSTNQALPGSGAVSWSTVSGTGSAVLLSTSPGVSGINAGSSIASSQHDFYASLSMSPNSISSKYSSLYVEMEYN